ncbi:MAG: rRNA maturation RNase YbeY [Betaproteobacteria bacterium]|nr:rRNA maturation RNase YbeY [Betaproteobacteria bacterium]
MGSKYPVHKISFSLLPGSIAAGPKGQKLRLRWDRKAMTRRLAFVLELMCEGNSRVHIEFVDELQMGSLNWQFRGKDKPTDVLSFPPHPDVETDAPESSRARGVNLGELAVCVPVCATQARSHRCSLAQEIERMMIHGLVHLKGFDHERSDAAYAVMTLLERGLRVQLNSALGEPDFCEEETAQAKRVTESPKRRTSR